MTNLEEFLNDQPKKKITTTFDEVEGSFKCQDANCDEVVTSAGMDRQINKVFWVCDKGHESSVAI
jgi:hypothetical protein